MLKLCMLVAECIIIENKSVREMHPIDEAQLLTHLKLSDHRLGFLVNWNVVLIKDGIERMVAQIRSTRARLHGTWNDSIESRRNNL